MSWLEIIGVFALAQYALLGVLGAWCMYHAHEEDQL